MKIYYNVTGKERKRLVGAVSTVLNAPAKYLGAPTFAYEVGGYHIDKEGTVTGPDNYDLADKLFDGYELICAELAYDKPEDAETAAEPDRLTVEYPLGGMNPDILGNLTKMVQAKAPLLQAALGTDELLIQMREEDGGKLLFPWFTLDDPSDAAYYVQFIWALCATAREKKRVTVKECGIADNPKYAMRCWLLALGLIGGEYKNARKLLLSRLEGNSSFKGGSRPTYTAHCFTYPNGSEEDAMDCETFEFTSLKAARAKCDEFLQDCESVTFAGTHVESDNGVYLYEILTDGTVNEK